MSIQDNTFAAACYDQNTIAELEASLLNDADAEDMEAWKISESEWLEQIKLALFELYKDEFDSVEFEGGEYALTQNAHICDSGNQYQAIAVNENGENFTVLWDVISDDPDNETDESNMCDWEKPSEIVAHDE
ncbi:hypothetical protein BGL48_11960 [Salinivibrio sp. SS3]|uniref:Uncharacterized protein n=1 Tax=Salinivibrio phage SMHB1 TaxID=1897436 RepID=A0A1D9C9T8_9CAUD|nr:hypothetical protein [Salinivibrio sp. BNH]YP_009786963.1 hypothetical protein HOR26_gp21 [Salinivibrio phage SMHB1]AOY11826.1 hypothetical protein [Salinivibrio phage SMHB1]ODP98289.1 hypothetical protein BGL48_11960 [Salinivibrio sp. BNH]